MYRFRYPASAFTLTEILIALTLIGVLITLPVVAYTNYLKTSRDLKRKQDLSQIQSSLEQYKTIVGLYPPTDTWENVLVAGGYMDSVPRDPYDGRAIPGETGIFFGYVYEQQNGGTSYRLLGRLEGGASGGSYYILSPEGPRSIIVTPGSGIPPSNTPRVSTPRVVSYTPRPSRVSAANPPRFTVRNGNLYKCDAAPLSGVSCYLIL